MYDFERNREKLILERRRTVAKGDNNLAVGNYFTHSFNMGCGDRSFMQCVWQVISLTAQQVYAVCVLNVEQVEKEDSMFKYVGRRHMFDRGEYEFYDAADLYATIVEERRVAREAQEAADAVAKAEAEAAPMFVPEPDEVEA